MKLILIIMITVVNFAFIPPVKASTCRTYGDNQTCITSIKRSAKYYWRYRTEIRINGIRQPMMIYDCRQQKKFTKNGVSIPFKKVGIENFICGTLNKK